MKRLFSKGRFTIERLEQICSLLGFTLAELVQESASAVPQLRILESAQEAQLVSNERLLPVMVCALNHWSVDDIVSTYRIRRTEQGRRLTNILERSECKGHCRAA